MSRQDFSIADLDGWKVVVDRWITIGRPGRQDRGGTGTSVADAMGVSPAEVSRFKNGDAGTLKRWLSLDRIADFARVVGVTEQEVRVELDTFLQSTVHGEPWSPLFPGVPLSAVRQRPRFRRDDKVWSWQELQEAVRQASGGDARRLPISTPVRLVAPAGTARDLAKADLVELLRDVEEDGITVQVSEPGFGGRWTTVPGSVELLPWRIVELAEISRVVVDLPGALHDTERAHLASFANWLDEAKPPMGGIRPAEGVALLRHVADEGPPDSLAALNRALAAALWRRALVHGVSLELELGAALALSFLKGAPGRDEPWRSWTVRAEAAVLDDLRAWIEQRHGWARFTDLRVVVSELGSARGARRKQLVSQLRAAVEIGPAERVLQALVDARLLSRTDDGLVAWDNEETAVILATASLAESSLRGWEPFTDPRRLLEPRWTRLVVELVQMGKDLGHLVPALLDAPLETALESNRLGLFVLARSPSATAGSHFQRALAECLLTDPMYADVAGLTWSDMAETTRVLSRRFRGRLWRWEPDRLDQLRTLARPEVAALAESIPVRTGASDELVGSLAPWLAPITEDELRGYGFWQTRLDQARALADPGDERELVDRIWSGRWIEDGLGTPGLNALWMRLEPVERLNATDVTGLHALQLLNLHLRKRPEADEGDLSGAELDACVRLALRAGQDGVEYACDELLRGTERRSWTWPLELAWAVLGTAQAASALEQLATAAERFVREVQLTRDHGHIRIDWGELLGVGKVDFDPAKNDSARPRNVATTAVEGIVRRLLDVGQRAAELLAELGDTSELWRRVRGDSDWQIRDELIQELGVLDGIGRIVDDGMLALFSRPAPPDWTTDEPIRPMMLGGWFLQQEHMPPECVRRAEVVLRAADGVPLPEDIAGWFRRAALPVGELKMVALSGIGAHESLAALVRLGPETRSALVDWVIGTESSARLSYWDAFRELTSWPDALDQLHERCESSHPIYGQLLREGLGSPRDAKPGWPRPWALPAALAWAQTRPDERWRLQRFADQPEVREAFLGWARSPEIEWSQRVDMARLCAEHGDDSVWQELIDQWLARVREGSEPELGHLDGRFLTDAVAKADQEALMPLWDREVTRSRDGQPTFGIRTLAPLIAGRGLASVVVRDVAELNPLGFADVLRKHLPEVEDGVVKEALCAAPMSLELFFVAKERGLVDDVIADLRGRGEDVPGLLQTSASGYSAARDLAEALEGGDAGAVAAAEGWARANGDAELQWRAREVAVRGGRSPGGHGG